ASHAYALDHYLSSFAGLAPLDHPRLAIVALVDDPSGGDHFGGKVAGPVFARVASEALRYLGVPGEPEVGPPAPPAPPGAAAASRAQTCIPAPPALRSPTPGNGPAAGSVPTTAAGAGLAGELAVAGDGSDPMFGTWTPWLAPPFASLSPPSQPSS